jgi:hypothetical protein
VFDSDDGREAVLFQNFKRIAEETKGIVYDIVREVDND